MPLYEYRPSKHRCNYCVRGFTVTQAIDDAALTACPECGNPVERLISAPSSVKAETLDPARLAEGGITTYRRVGKGAYEKVGGDPDAPDTI